MALLENKNKYQYQNPVASTLGSYCRDKSNLMDRPLRRSRTVFFLLVKFFSTKHYTNSQRRLHNKADAFQKKKLSINTHHITEQEKTNRWYRTSSKRILIDGSSEDGLIQINPYHHYLIRFSVVLYGFPSVVDG